MPIEWQNASRKFKIAWFSWLIGAPVLSVIIWRMEIPYIEIYLAVIAAAAWTAAIIFKRKRKVTGNPPEETEEGFKGEHR